MSGTFRAVTAHFQDPDQAGQAHDRPGSLEQDEAVLALDQGHRRAPTIESIWLIVLRYRALR